MFYFSDNSLVFMPFFMFLHCFPIMVIVISISNEKLNGHLTFESLDFLGALTFLFKQHIS